MTYVRIAQLSPRINTSSMFQCFISFHYCFPFIFLNLNLRINNECVKNREARISIDLVKDEVENSLEREVENIKTYQQRMQKMLAKVQKESRGY